MAAINKPEPRAKAKARAKRQKAKARAICLEVVWGRARGRCESCSLKVWRVLETDDPRLVGHVHEILPRSLGGDPTDPEQTILLCPKCHAAAHHLNVRTDWPEKARNHARPKPLNPPF